MTNASLFSSDAEDGNGLSKGVALLSIWYILLSLLAAVRMLTNDGPYELKLDCS